MTSQQEILSQISEKTGKKMPELNQELEGIYNEWKKLQPNEKEDILRAQALQRLKALYRKQLTSRAEKFTGVFIGSMRKLDMVKKKREACLEEYRKNPQQAIKNGVVDQEGNPLEWVPQAKFDKFQDWQVATNFIEDEKGPLARKDKTGKILHYIGKPLPAEDFNRTVFGAVNADGKWIKCEMRLRGDNCDITIPTFCILNFSAVKGQMSNEQYFRLYDIKNLNFEIIKELEDSEAVGLLSIFQTIKVNQIEPWTKDPKNAGFGSFVIMRALVETISTNVTKTGMQPMDVSDETVEVTDEEGNIIPPTTAFLQPHVQLNFPEMSEVYFVGQPSMLPDNKTGEFRKTFSVYGVYVPKMYRNNVPVMQRQESTEQW